ncbi:MAG: phosphoglycerate dehydrogenase [Syntrophobacteraceae bacterium]|nr:phosphoglycerate dehydrogenase [Syntrophobacteraceae bacterium]
MSAIRVLIEARPFAAFDPAPMERLRDCGFDLIDRRGLGVNDPAFMEALQQVDLVLSGNDLVVSAELLDRAPNLRAVCKLGVGLDMIDMGAATARGVIVFHTPGANDQAVADHTFALILSLARQIVRFHTGVRAGLWEHTTVLGMEIAEKTFGILGLGSIGRSVALRAKGFGCEVVACDPFWPQAFASEHKIRQVELGELLRVSDIVSLHCPYLPSSYKLIGERELSLMKKTAILVNTARGELVDEAALCRFLKEGRIAGAALDVLETEPPKESEILTAPNVIVTPHTAAFTLESMNKMSKGCVDQIIEYASGQLPRHTVNREAFYPYGTGLLGGAAGIACDPGQCSS